MGRVWPYTVNRHLYGCSLGLCRVGVCQHVRLVKTASVGPAVSRGRVFGSRPTWRAEWPMQPGHHQHTVGCRRCHAPTCGVAVADRTPHRSWLMRQGDWGPDSNGLRRSKEAQLDYVEEVTLSQVPADHKEALLSLFEKDDVWEAISSLRLSKSPEPDRFTAHFSAELTLHLHSY
ncbi:hypothetical protein NDU88_005080 [Pleurodeles waltl]|uniref:Uncharacterized protein n=1 Tax=Pleurodeles waltl TaxID=8319 RepID=A0AAV7W739_PLEWA|nr:hypothetical protein NDU88_005080 [Pleurodeles waltl]